MSLLMHCGAFRASYEDILDIPTPEATDTWEPIPHHQIIDQLHRCADSLNWQVHRANYGLTPKGDRMFGVIDFLNDTHPDYGWSIGFRNSHDKSMAAGVCAGARVFVCDNLALKGEYIATKRHVPRHEFLRNLQDAFKLLPDQLANLQKNLDRLKLEGIAEDGARLLIFQAAEQKIIPSSEVIQIWDEFQKPTYPEFRDPNRFNLLMAFTEIAKKYNSNSKAESVYRKVGKLFSL
jgi:hypothetical protein